MQQRQWPIRVCVYIDGFNVLYAIKEQYGKKYYWLDYMILAKNLLKHNEKNAQLPDVVISKSGKQQYKRPKDWK